MPDEREVDAAGADRTDGVDTERDGDGDGVERIDGVLCVLGEITGEREGVTLRGELKVGRDGSVGVPRWTFEGVRVLNCGVLKLRPGMVCVAGRFNVADEDSRAEMLGRVNVLDELTVAGAVGELNVRAGFTALFGRTVLIV